MYKVLKWTFELGYKFAERHYYQKLVMSVRSRAEQDLMYYSAKDDKGRLERVRHTTDLESALMSHIDEAFGKSAPVYIDDQRKLPFDDEVV